MNDFEQNLTDAIEPTLLDTPGHYSSRGTGSHNYPSQASPQQNYASDETVLITPNSNSKPSFAWLVVVKGKGAPLGQLFALNARGSNIGRSDQCDVSLTQDRAVGRVHAKVYKEGDDFVIHDLASRNHTFVNGQEVYHQALKENDTITIGETVLIFKEIRDVDLNS